MGYTEKKREITRSGGECPSCNRAADLKAKADVLHRLMGELEAQSVRPDSVEVDPTPAQRETAAWSLAIDVGLTREMAPHPRCDQCGILMGPGHIEAGTAQRCGTCCSRNSNSLPTYADCEARLVGRRGWFSDHVARQKR